MKKVKVSVTQWFLTLGDPVDCTPPVQARATTISEDEAADIQYDTAWESLELDFLPHFAPLHMKSPMCTHWGAGGGLGDC